MKLHAFIVLTAGLALAGRSAGEDIIRKDQEKLQGTWSLVSVEINGKALPREAIQGAELVVKRGKYAFTLGDTQLEITYKLDPAKKPKTIDITFNNGPQQGKTFRGIYALEKDKFKVCRAVEPEKERPTEFATRADSGLMLVVYKREKSAEKGKPAKILGTLTLDGKPVEGTSVMLVPVADDGRPASALTGKDGSFRLTTFKVGDGALSGEYKIIVTKEGSNVAAVYSDPARTPLRYKAPSDGKLVLELRSR